MPGSMRGCVVALVVLLPSAACTTTTPPATTTAAADDAAADTVWHAAVLPGYEAPADAGPGWYVFRGRDPGIGLVYFDFAGLEPPVRRMLAIHERPDADAAIVARFVLDMPSGWSYSYAVEVREAGLSANVLEYGYEESGVPLDSVSADGTWARLIHAYDAAGAQRHGWVRLGTPGTGHILWRDWLGERAQFFASDDAIDLRDAPAGDIVAFELQPSASGYPSGYDYHLEADSVAGEWVRVRVVTPSDACGMEPGPTRDTVAWTRLVDDRGRPRVWYFSRGC